jgi:peptide deformylase
MALRRVLQIDDDEDRKTLKMRCRPIKLPDKRLKALIDDMFETMRANDGVGLAAPQVGLPIRLIVIEVPPTYEEQEDGTKVEVSPAEQYYFINPKIVKMSSEEVIRNEGCLSLPGWYGDVPRASWVTVEYQELNGKQRRMRKVDGILGWVLQHEVDHLEGILFTERIRDLSTLRDARQEEQEAEAARAAQEEAAQEEAAQKHAEALEVKA